MYICKSCIILVKLGNLLEKLKWKIYSNEEYNLYKQIVLLTVFKVSNWAIKGHSKIINIKSTGLQHNHPLSILLQNRRPRPDPGRGNSTGGMLARRDY